MSLARSRSGGSVDLDDAQPVVQVLAERALRDHRREVAVGRGDDRAPRACMRLRIADALERALLQHAQQLRLELERDLADLVEEQRALAGELEAAGAVGDRAGERALDVPEQLALEHAGRERGAVDRDERPLAVCADAVWIARATSSLPVPDSPVISTGARVVDTAPICFHTSRIGALLPRMSPASRAARARARRAACARVAARRARPSRRRAGDRCRPA